MELTVSVSPHLWIVNKWGTVGVAVFFLFIKTAPSCQVVLQTAGAGAILTFAVVTRLDAVIFLAKMYAQQ